MYSRRDLGKIALAGLPVGLARAVKVPSSTLAGVAIGVITGSFRDLVRPPGTDPADAVINAMASIGLSHIELGLGALTPNELRSAAFGGRGGVGAGSGQAIARPGDPEGAVYPVSPGQNGPPAPPTPEQTKVRSALRQWRLTTPLSYFEAVRQKFNAAGIKIHVFQPGFSLDLSNEELDRYFEIAKALGVSTLSAIFMLDVAEKVAPFADKHKMYVGLHPHDLTDDTNQISTPRTFVDAMKMSKYFKVNLDIGHYRAAGCDAIRYIRENHDHISHLHLQDRLKDHGPIVPFGKGDTPITEVLSFLRDNWYPLPVMIEYEYHGAGSSTDEVRKCFEYCRRALT